MNGPETAHLDFDRLDVAAVDHVLSTARSVRRKLDFDKKLPPDVLFDCINVATQAPTGLVGENWRFVVVTEARQKQRLAELYKTVLIDIFQQRDMPMKPSHRALIDRLHDIPAMIFVCAIGTPASSDAASQLGFYGSVLPAAWSLMLALRARGIGTTWTSLLSARQGEVAHVLDIPDGVTQTVMLPVAYTLGAKLKRADRLDAREVTYWNRWGYSSPDGMPESKSEDKPQSGS